MNLDRSARVYVAGHRGLAGSAILRTFASCGFTDLIGRGSDELDLRDRDAVFEFFGTERPEVVILAAARVGGIAANAARPVDFLSENLRIQLNVLDAAHAHNVRRLLFLGSSCIYPRDAPQPIREEYLLTGPLEQTNDAYAIAKIAGIMHVQALRRQYRRSYVAAMPSNLYGPGDNFDPDTAHVLPALIARFHAAKEQDLERVVLWGNGSARREFLHVDDLAAACLAILDSYDDPMPINVGTGSDLAIRQLARLVADVVGYTGAISWDTRKPDGTPRKLLDISRINRLGWTPHVSLIDGITDTYTWYRMRSERVSRVE